MVARPSLTHLVFFRHIVAYSVPLCGALHLCTPRVNLPPRPPTHTNGISSPYYLFQALCWSTNVPVKWSWNSSSWPLDVSLCIPVQYDMVAMSWPLYFRPEGEIKMFRKHSLLSVGTPVFETRPFRSGDKLSWPLPSFWVWAPCPPTVLRGHIVSIERKIIIRVHLPIGHPSGPKFIQCDSQQYILKYVVP